MSVLPLRVRFVLLVMVTAGGYATATVRGAGAVPVRHALAATNDPVGGKGRTLGLTRVTIPAGAQLALHHHPGTEIAYIQPDRCGSDRFDWRRRVIVEQPTTIHRAANNGTQPIVIYLATFFPIGSPPSIPVG